MSATPQDRARRLANKRFNERVKLGATSIGAVALAVFGAAVIVPVISNVAVLLSFEPWLLFLSPSSYI